ncbi:unnamed protein product [Penicillium crustosum]
MMSSSDNLQPQAIALIFAFPCFATVAVALRLYSRTLTKSFAAVRLLVHESNDSSVIIYVYIGYNVWDIPPHHPVILGGKYTYATEVIYNPILALVKTSILLFLLRLTGQKKLVRLAIWGLLIVNGIAAIITFFITVFRCTPIAANWDLASYPNAKCLDFANFVTATGAVSVLTDVLALILPTWIVYQLQMKWTKKLMLIGILSLGLLTVVAGITRLILLDKFDRHMPKNSTHSLLFCLSTIEVGLSFLAACAPSFKPLVTWIVPRLFGSTRTDLKAGSTSRRGRTWLSYNLEETSSFTPRTHDQTITTVAAGHDGTGRDCRKFKADNIITMTTQMEVTWGRSDCEERDTSSTESLVHGMGRSRPSQ